MILDAVGGNESLTELSVQGFCAAPDDDLPPLPGAAVGAAAAGAALARALRRNATLRSLSVSREGPGCDAWQPLVFKALVCGGESSSSSSSRSAPEAAAAPFPSSRCGLTSLNLRGVFLTPEGAAALGSVLRRRRSPGGEGGGASLLSLRELSVRVRTDVVFDAALSALQGAPPELRHVSLTVEGSYRFSDEEDGARLPPSLVPACCRDDPCWWQAARHASICLLSPLTRRHRCRRFPRISGKAHAAAVDALARALALPSCPLTSVHLIQCGVSEAGGARQQQRRHTLPRSPPIPARRYFRRQSRIFFSWRT